MRSPTQQSKQLELQLSKLKLLLLPPAIPENLPIYILLSTTIKQTNSRLPPKMSNSKSTFQSFSTSFSSSSVNGQTKSHSETTYSDPSGTRVHRTSQTPGEAPREERFEVDDSGRRVEGAGTADQRRIEDVTEEEEQKENDRKYEERMEDEYAKKEGGA